MLAAVYGPQDVTLKARQLVEEGNELAADNNTFVDTWKGVRKVCARLCVLFYVIAYHWSSSCTCTQQTSVLGTPLPSQRPFLMLSFSTLHHIYGLPRVGACGGVSSRWRHHPPCGHV